MKGRAVMIKGDRVRRGEVGGGRRAVPGGAAAGDSCRAVQAAEHVEQRRGLRGRGRDGTRVGGAGAGGRSRAADGLQSGAAEAAGRPRLSGRGARAAGGDDAVMEFDLVIVEGAGSPAEVSTRRR